jgi:CheY-like chemotaxis protein
VTSTVGIGSMFWIELDPAEASIPVLVPEEAAPQARIRHTHDSPPTLLYVEDNPANLKLVEQILSFHTKLHLISARDGAQGIALARLHLPHVILMDMNLPGISGREARRILQDDPETAGIPVIALTANAMPHDVKAGLAAGFYRYITKPIKIDELIEAINSALELSKREQSEDV